VPESDNEVQTTQMREKRHSEITRLICADATAHGSTKTIDPTVPANKAPHENIGEHLVVDDEKPLILSPMIITGRKPPPLLMPKESYSERYFRTGMLAQHVGKDVTTSFGFTRSKGLFLSLDF